MLTGTQIAIIVIIIVVLVVIGFILFYSFHQNVTTGMAPNTTITYKQSKPHREIPEANRINLFIEYYIPKSKERRQEIDFSLKTNLNEKALDRVFVIVHNKEEETAVRAFNTRRTIPLRSPKGKEQEDSDDEEEERRPRSSSLDGTSMRVPAPRSTRSADAPKRVPGGVTMSFIRIKNPRPSYGEIFTLIKKYSGHDDVNIFCNSDIAFDSTIGLVRRLDPQEAVALTRWNIEDYKMPLRGRLENDQKWTQDTWIIRGTPHPSLLGVSFGTGLLRCDNRIAYILSEEAGYKVFNPCHSIKSYHVHKSGVRNYTPVNVGKIHPSDYSKHGIVEGNGSYVLASVWM